MSCAVACRVWRALSILRKILSTFGLDSKHCRIVVVCSQRPKCTAEVAATTVKVRSSFRRFENEADGVAELDAKRARMGPPGGYGGGPYGGGGESMRLTAYGSSNTSMQSSSGYAPPSHSMGGPSGGGRPSKVVHVRGLSDAVRTRDGNFEERKFRRPTPTFSKRLAASAPSTTCR